MGGKFYKKCGKSYCMLGRYEVFGVGGWKVGVKFYRIRERGANFRLN